MVLVAVVVFNEVRQVQMGPHQVAKFHFSETPLKVVVGVWVDKRYAFSPGDG